MHNNSGYLIYLFFLSFFNPTIISIIKSSAFLLFNIESAQIGYRIVQQNNSIGYNSFFEDFFFFLPTWESDDR
jgi:hypothetical protein